MILDSTCTELQIYFDVAEQKYKDKLKVSLEQNYLLAALVSQFVNLSMSGKPLPKIYELFPEQFEAPKISNAAYVQRWRDFAAYHNSRFQKGDTK